MNKIAERIVNQFNFKKTADELGVHLWQAPNFLFLLMGVFISVAMITIYYVTRDYSDPWFLILIEFVTVITMLSIGSSIIDRIHVMAQVNKVKNRFLEIASNRLKDPLATMRWELNLLMDDSLGPINDKQKNTIKSIVESNENMTNMVKDLLDIARVEIENKKKEKRKVNVFNLVSVIITEVRKFAESKEIKIVYDNDYPLGAIKGNDKLIKIALENLITNAIRFSDYKDEVRVRVIKEKSRLIFSVKDSGCGIPEGEKSYIFDKFFRASNVLDHEIEGTGLGLYIAKKIIDETNGRIWFDSVVGEGSEFYVSFPLV